MEAWQNEVRENGYVFLRAHRATEFTRDRIEQFGPIADLAEVRAVQELTPKTRGQSTPNTYSGRYGHGQFPLHTDLAHWGRPPRYLVLRCKAGSAQVTTALLDGRVLVEAVGEKLLFRSVVRSRRPVSGVVRRMRLLVPMEQNYLLRWDDEYLRPASAAAAEGMKSVVTALGSIRPRLIALCEPGDTIIVDNWRMLHGRSAVAPEHAGRLIQRAYLEALN